MVTDINHDFFENPIVFYLTAPFSSPSQKETSSKLKFLFVLLFFRPPISFFPPFARGATVIQDDTRGIFKKNRAITSARRILGPLRLPQ